MYLVGEGIRVLILISGLPIAFWPYAGIAFCNAFNCVSSDVNALCPYEVRHKDRPVPTLHQFGCLVYVVPSKVDKVKPRGEECIYLGHNVTSGGIVSQGEIVYCKLCHWTEGKKIHISTSRDFRFPAETSFPLQEFRLRQSFETFKGQEKGNFDEYVSEILTRLSHSELPASSEPAKEPEHDAIIDIGDPESPTLKEIAEENVEVEEADEADEEEEPSSSSSAGPHTTPTTTTTPSDSEKDRVKMIKKYELFEKARTMAL